MILSEFQLPLIELFKQHPGTTRSEHYRHLLGLALRSNAEPRRVDISVLRRGSVRLSVAAVEKIKIVANRSGLDFKQAFAGLCIAGEELLGKNEAHLDADRRGGIEDRQRFEPKSHSQRRYYEQCLDALKRRKIVFAEGSTGIGKTRTFIAAAIWMANDGRAPVVICSPTVAVMEHQYREMLRSGADESRFTILPGAAEFVDDRLVNAYLEALGPATAVASSLRAWVEGGARACNPDSPLVKAIGPSAAWLMEDFRQHAGAIPTDDFRLRADLSEGQQGARAVLKHLRQKARSGTEVIFCTHAMLALSQKHKWSGSLPPPSVLFVDEAHQFEQAVASINTAQFSIYSLRVKLAKLRRKDALGQTSSAVKASSLLIKITKMLQRFDASSNRTCLTDIRLRSESEMRGLLLSLTELQSALKSRALEKVNGIQEARVNLRNMLESFQQGRLPANHVYVTFSENRRFPSLQCGPAHVDIQLRNIWRTATNGVVLASATLYILDPHGNRKCDYVRQLLAVPIDRMSTPAPVVDDYIFSLPTVYVPSITTATFLSPPKKNDENMLSAWHAAVASHIRRIIDGAAGGTLVLLTSYRDASEISKLLRELGVADVRIVEQTRNTRFSECERRFRDLHAQHLRPILMALGGAWTGVDFKDEAYAAHDDFLLSDLIIARLPIGFNRSNSMTARIEQSGLNAVVNEALLTFKQGLGRLIRRQGVLNRRVWILDGRPFVQEKWQGMDVFTACVRRLLREYQKRVEF